MFEFNLDYSKAVYVFSAGIYDKQVKIICKNCKVHFTKYTQVLLCLVTIKPVTWQVLANCFTALC